MLAMTSDGLRHDDNGALYVAQIPAGLTPARTESGSLMAVQHPRDGQWGVPVLTSADEVCLLAAGVTRSLPPDLVAAIRHDQCVRCSGWDNCSDDADVIAEWRRWAKTTH
jgi:hypothetical protein